MAHGGRRQGAGRKAGSVTTRTRDVANAVASSGLTPLEYLTSVYQDVAADEAKRIDAAKAAAPYVHAKLSTVDLKANVAANVALTEIRRTIVRPSGH